MEDEISNLSMDVKRRLNALHNLNVKRSKIHREFLKEVAALEKKYHALYQPLYDKRAEIVAGSAEPTDEEATVANELQDFTKLEATEGQIVEMVPTKGIPGFWCTALTNNQSISEMITDRDVEALKYLIDIKVSYLEDNPGFALDFVFAENEFFSNTVLTKKYFLTDSEGEDESVEEEYILDRTEGTEIQWKEGKDLSVKVEVKKQRHKNTNKTRVVKRTVPSETFFNFFKSQQLPSSPDEALDMEMEDAQMLEQTLQLDYQIGEEIKDDVVPRALDWYTGEADGDDDMDSFDYEGMDDSEGDGLDEDLDDDEDDE